ncbi:hypothetical protein PAESOLCIP111_03459 [Paenibacillus solanacearum]|uniref:Uncharacterized protein n=1 Tax=Paenibacillus solanacearum TaxID=2048548 RepID=A0A916K3N4_9BACL|nr:hypothetical protein [Paenibacillus solanacearum]CAG7633236.1 hypothetical protein PAESOLCIP111_03459 [Paenibacillus solanacearum]
MSEDTNKQILEELRAIHRKLDAMDSPRGLSTPLKFIAVVLGITIVGPLLLIVVGLISRFVS